MKHTRHPPAPNTLQPGHYIFWQQRTYQVIALDPDNALLLHVQSEASEPGTQLSLLDLLAVPRTSPSAPLFAPTLEALHQQIEERYGRALGTTTHDLPNSFVIKARIITSVVEMVRRLVESDERRAKARKEPISHYQAICRALLTVNKTIIRLSPFYLSSPTHESSTVSFRRYVFAALLRQHTQHQNTSLSDGLGHP